MTTRDSILASPETISDLTWAAEQRFRDAEELLSAGRLPGSVYLFGLSAEMWLKLAGFRTAGASPATPVSGLLGPARAWMHAHAPSVHPESYHSLLFWVEYLIRRRAAAGSVLPALSASLSGDLRHHVGNRLFTDWKIEIRYRQVPITEARAWRVYNDVVWLRGTFPRLWR